MFQGKFIGVLVGIIVWLAIVIQPVQAMSTFINGAHTVNAVNYDDLTTNNPVIGNLSEARRAALGENDWSSGKPQRPEWYTPKVKIPGMEISGYFEDCYFVIRVPEKWNGRLVVVGSPGFGDARSTDALISDYVLTKLDNNGASYAYAVCDKGTTGEQIPAPDGKIYPWAKAMTALSSEQDSIEEWNTRLHQLTIATKDVLKRLRGKTPEYTYLWGYSNGGYVTRYAIEHDAELYDGMVDWEGVLWRAHEENLISSLTTAVNAWQVLKDPSVETARRETAIKSLNDLGLSKESQVLWPLHGSAYWLATLNLHRAKYDPEYVKRDWWEFLAHQEDYKNYNWFTRPETIKQRVAKMENNGSIKKPVITIHGTWDSLLFPNVHAKSYEQLVNKNGKGSMYRLYMVEHGNHFDSLVNRPGIDTGHQLQSLMPYVHQSFDALVDWVELGIPAPASMTIGIPQSTDKAIDIWTGNEITKY